MSMINPPVRSILRHLDSAQVSTLSQKESRNREVYLPPVSVYRWWARRTIAVNGAILDAFAQDFPGNDHLVLDPFEGGGVIPLAAVARGYRVYAQDLNPWAAHGLAAALSLADADDIRAGAKELAKKAEALAKKAYGTTLSTGEAGVISHTFRVSSSTCEACGVRMRHFPHAMVTLIRRKERGESACLLACSAGHVFPGTKDDEVACPKCERVVDPSARYTRGRDVTCWSCQRATSLDDPYTTSTWKWEVVLVERVSNSGAREIGTATDAEIKKATTGWKPRRNLGAIPRGGETEVLLRHGFVSWGDIYPARQRAVTEQLLGYIDEVADLGVREALRWALLGTTEMAGYLSRWDRWYLKSYEAMAGHRFNFTTFATEPNVYGVEGVGRGTFLRRVSLMCKAAEWLRAQPSWPVDVVGPEDVPVKGAYDVRVVCASSEHIALRDGEVQLCLTDPPYHDDVQYGELSLPLRAWAGLDTAPLEGEAVVNIGSGANAAEGEYGALLTRIFSEVRRCLADDGHLVFSYANRVPEVWADVIAALDAAGFRCAGYTTVHSENETDSAKKGVRACTQDLILDMVPASSLPIRRSHPTFVEPTAEEQFLGVVGSYLLRTGSMPKKWRTNMIADLNATEFLA